MRADKSSRSFPFIQGAAGGDAQLRAEHEPPDGAAAAADDARRARPRQGDRHPQGVGQRRRRRPEMQRRDII